MTHPLRITRGVVQVLAGIISVAFFINSFNGVLGAIDLGDGNIDTTDIAPGDFQVNFSNLSIDIGVEITNPGKYDIEGVIVSILFEIRTTLDPTWIAVLDNNTVDLGIAPAGGETITPGQNKTIGIQADLEDFVYTPTEIGTLFSLPPGWNLSDLLGTGFEARMSLDFSIAYAFGQYQLDAEISLANDAIQTGLGGS